MFFVGCLTSQQNASGIIMMIIIIIVFKGATRDFLQSPHCSANRLQHVRSSGPGAIVCKSRTTHRALITCNMLCATWYEGTAQLLSIYLSFILLAEPISVSQGRICEENFTWCYTEIEAADQASHLTQSQYTKHRADQSVRRRDIYTFSTFDTSMTRFHGSQ